MENHTPDYTSSHRADGLMNERLAAAISSLRAAESERVQEGRQNEASFVPREPPSSHSSAARGLYFGASNCSSVKQ